MRPIYFISFIFLFLLNSCNKHEDKIIENRKNITLIYMIADNDLASFAVKDINEMEHNFMPSDTEKILIYVDSSPSKELPLNPILLELEQDTTKQIKSKILISYPEQNSTDKDVFQTVLNDAFGYYNRASNPKGLVLWSHGNAWLPNDFNIPTTRSLVNQNTTNNNIPAFKYFGQDNTPTKSVMEITDLADALSSYHFNYILFDACFMASIEVFYELRKSANYFIASPCEILANGFPYDKIIPKMTQPKINLLEICEDFYNHYNIKKGIFQSAAISLINSDYLEDFAFFCQTNLPPIPITTNNLQQYSRNNENLLFDLKQILNNFGKNYNNWNKMVAYERHTTNMTTLSLKNCHGISTYIFNNKKYLNEYYKKLSWYKHSVRYNSDNAN